MRVHCVWVFCGVIENGKQQCDIFGFAGFSEIHGR